MGVVEILMGSWISMLAGMGGVAGPCLLFLLEKEKKEEEE